MTFLFVVLLKWDHLQVVRVLFGNDLYDVVWLGGFLGCWDICFLIRRASILCT